MQLSQDLVGQIVSVQIARPMYTLEYAAHFYAPDGVTVKGHLIQPATEEDGKPMVMDLLVGVEVTRVTETSLSFVYLSPNGFHEIERTVPLAIVICVDRVKAFAPPRPLMRTEKASPIVRI